jgi:hypothetical protein
MAAARVMILSAPASRALRRSPAGRGISYGVGVIKRGAVRIREEFTVEVPFYRYTAAWLREPDSPPIVASESPGWNDVAEAVRWGRRHAPFVYVRLGPGGSEVYNAGERDDDVRHPTDRWPGTARRRAANRDPAYAGAVYIDEAWPDLWPKNTFAAEWIDDGEEPIERANFADIELAIDWARERAPTVLVAEAPNSWSFVPTYELSSAGEEDPPGQPLPRLRPRRGETLLKWEFATQRAAQTRSRDDLLERLQDALDQDAEVLTAACSAAPDWPPPARSLPAVISERPLSQGELTALEHARREPSSDAWTALVIHVAAPRRQQAYDTARRAVDRAIAAAGEHTGGWIGPERITAVG